MELRKQAKLPREGEIEKRESERKDETDETLGENVESDGRGEDEAGQQSVVVFQMEVAGRTNPVEGDEETVHSDRHPKRHNYVRNVKARVEKRADAGGEPQRGVEGCALAIEQPQRECIGGQQQRKRQQGERQPACPVVRAEQAHRAGCEPVHQRRLVEKADAVDVWRDIVMSLQHLARDFEVDRVNVIEQPRCEEAADVQNEPREHDERDGSRTPAALRAGCVNGLLYGWSSELCCGRSQNSELRCLSLAWSLVQRRGRVQRRLQRPVGE